MSLSVREVALKSLFVFITFVVVAAGVVAGRLDYEAEKRPAVDPGVDTPPAGGTSAPAGQDPKPPGSGQESAPRQVVRVDDPAEPESGRTPTSPESPEASARGADTRARDSDPVRPRSDYELSPASAREVERIETALKAHDFDQAEKAAGLLADKNSSGSEEAYVTARQLEAKARIYRQLMTSAAGDDGARASEGSVGGFEVELSNGNKITAQSVKRAQGHYVIVLENGNKFRPPVEDVLEVKKVQSASRKKESWEQLAVKLEGISDPIELYVRGVKKCCRIGLKTEAYDLMERVLDSPESDSVPMLFAHQGGIEALRDWRLAAGRVPREEILPERAPAIARTESRVTGEPPLRRSPRISLEPGGRADPEAFSRAQSLVRSARSLYSQSVGKDGRTRDLKEARRRLDQALAILEPLPDSAAVNRLRQELGQLLYDVIRSSPF